MSERPIQVGDLVQVVRPAPCCGGVVGLGYVFRVSSFDTNPGKCFQCGSWESNACDAVDPTTGDKYMLERLRRIPPLSELEGARDASGLDERLPTREGFEAQIKKMQEALK